ncbi:IS256 family transposase [Klebsiella sp. WOUb02]
MADNSMALNDTLMQLGGEDFLRDLTEFMLNRIMDADVTAGINADRHERTEDRETYRNGYRDRAYNTRVGTLDLRIPKLREGTCFPSFLEARKLSEKALNAVIQEAWINGVSTSKVDALVQSMGMTGISRSQVSSVCRDIDGWVKDFLERPVEGDWPCLWLDATYVKVRKGGRVVSVAVIIACAVNPDGRREIIGMGIAGSTRPISRWCELYCSRCSYRLTPKRRMRPGKLLPGRLEESFPSVAALMDDAEADVLAYFDFPKAHRVKLHSTNTLERLNKEVKRRADVVGIFPNEAGITRLLGAVLAEQNEDWLLQNRYMPQQSMLEIDQNADDNDVIDALPISA